MATGVLERLVSSIEALDFESKKEAARLFNDVVRMCARPVGTGSSEKERDFVRHLQGHPAIILSIVDGCGKASTFSHCADMLRSCTRLPGLVALLLEKGAASHLVDLAQHDDFDVACEAFASLRKLLLAHEEVSSTYLNSAFCEFFELYHQMLESSAYVTQRQAVKLLGELLLNTSLTAVMRMYVTNDRFLRLHMNLLKGTSHKIQLDAFHVFKLFVANPKKPRAVQTILYKNKARLLDLLDVVAIPEEDDDNLAKDLNTVMVLLENLSPPPQKRPCLSLHQNYDVSRSYMHMDHRLLLAAP